MATNENERILERMRGLPAKSMPCGWSDEDGRCVLEGCPHASRCQGSVAAGGASDAFVTREKPRLQIVR